MVVITNNATHMHDVLARIHHNFTPLFNPLQAGLTLQPRHCTCNRRSLTGCHYSSIPSCRSRQTVLSACSILQQVNALFHVTPATPCTNNSAYTSGSLPPFNSNAHMGRPLCLQLSALCGTSPHPFSIFEYTPVSLVAACIFTK